MISQIGSKDLIKSDEMSTVLYYCTTQLIFALEFIFGTKFKLIVLIETLFRKVLYKLESNTISTNTQTT